MLVCEVGKEGEVDGGSGSNAEDSGKNDEG